MKSCYDNLPDGYHELLTVDLQKNKRVALLVNGLALLIAILMVLLGAYLVPFGMALRYIDPLSLLALFAAIVVYMLLHELTHGICMKLYGSGKVRYGFTGLYAFAGSGSYFARGPYIVIALAPVIVLGVVLLALNFVFSSGAAFWCVYIVQITNISGAAGDMYVTGKFLKLPRDILVHDSGVSMTVYAK